MDGTQPAVTMPKISKKLQTPFKNFLYKLIKTLCMLILNVIDNGLACDCGVCRVLIMTYHRFCKNLIP